MVKEIINWCNSNNGFATILLSALTLLVKVRSLMLLRQRSSALSVVGSHSATI